MRSRLLVLALCSAFATVSQAEGVGLYANGGTTGFGLGLTGGSNSMTGRFGFDTWKKTVTQNNTDGNYSLDLKLMNVDLLGDWYPFGGAFRATFGLVYNGNKASLTATPSATSQYKFNGQTYNASDVGSFTGEVKFKKTAPYLGVGWGNPVGKSKTRGFVSDIGILFQGSARVSSTVTCGASLTAPQCAQLKQDVAAGAVKLETDLKDFKKWPVASVGVSYNF